MTLEELKTHHPDLFDAVSREGIEEGKRIGANAERERILGIESRRMPGHEQLIEELKRDGKTTPVEAGDRIAQAERERLSKVSVSRRKDGEEIKSPAPQAALDQNKESAVTETQLLIHMAFGHSPEDIRKYLR